MLHSRKKKELVDSEENINKYLCTECPTNPEKGLYSVRGVTSKPIEQVRALGCNFAFAPSIMNISLMVVTSALVHKRRSMNSMPAFQCKICNKKIAAEYETCGCTQSYNCHE
jgi:hypothetical protein